MGGKAKTPDQLELLYGKIMEFLHGIDIEVILIYGTLLGYYRENNFINGDDDVDILVSRDDFNRLKDIAFTTNLTIKNINVVRIFYTNTNIISDNILQFYYKGEGPFDVCAYDFYEDNVLIKEDSLLYQTSDFFPLKKIFFRGFSVNIPYNIEKLLEITYGENWKVPLTKWKDYHPYDIYKKHQYKPTYIYKLPNIKIKHPRI